MPEVRSVRQALRAEGQMGETALGQPDETLGAWAAAVVVVAEAWQLLPEKESSDDPRPPETVA